MLRNGRDASRGVWVREDGRQGERGRRARERDEREGERESR